MRCPVVTERGHSACAQDGQTGMRKRLDAVMRTAQYLAALDPRQEVWAELGSVALHILDADVVAFAAPRHGRHPVFHHCAGDHEACRKLRTVATELVLQVIDSGFIASEMLRLGDEYCTVFLPLSVDGKTSFVMVLGKRGSAPASRDTLNLYLAIAGLFSSTLTRLASQRRFLAMADNVPEMLFQLVCYPDGSLEFAYVSGGSRATLGLSPEQLLAEPEQFFARLQADERADFEEAMMAGKGRLHRIFRGTDLEGQDQYLLCNAMPSPRADGGIVWDGAIQDISEHRRLEEERRDYLERLENSMEATVQAIAHTIEKRDPYTAGHQRRVAALTNRLCEELALSRDEMHGITLAASIHDIGKIHIPAEILSYPGKLGSIEYELVKTHAQIGYDILKSTEFPWPVALMVLQHHERMDGSGYPNQLRGDELLLGARIIAVADVVESIATFRPYREALGLEAALAEVEQNKDRLYDGDVVNACLRLFREKNFQFGDT